MALRKGPVMPVVLMTSMYPMITLMLCMLFLKQGLTLKQVAGMIFAVIALILFAME